MLDHQVMTAVITPFTTENTIDFTALKRIIDHLIAHSSDGLVMLGTTAESATLTKDERLMLYHFIMRYVNGRVPVYAGVGTNDTAVSLQYAKMAQSAHVDGIMIVAPYYNKPQQEGIYRHMKTIADQMTLPVMVYTVPSRCGITIEPETIIRLGNDCPNIVAYKYASSDLAPIPMIKEKITKPFAIYSGEDGMLLEGLRSGMDGIVSVISHVYGDEIKQVIEGYRNDTEQTVMDQLLKEKAKLLFCESSPVPIKYAMHLLGQCSPQVRLPLVELTQEHKEMIQAGIQDKL